MGSQIAIHQGKRWDSVARLRASHFAAEVQNFRIPLGPEGYTQGVLGVATLAAVLDFTGAFSVIAPPFRLARMKFFAADAVGDVKQITGTLVARSTAFTSQVVAEAFALGVVDKVRKWGDPLEGVLWILRDSIPFTYAVGCPGKHGLFSLPRDTEQAVRARLRNES